MLADRRSEGCEGCSCSEVMVSVCESMYERVGAEGLRWSLVLGLERTLEGGLLGVLVHQM